MLVSSKNDLNILKIRYIYIRSKTVYFFFPKFNFFYSGKVQFFLYLVKSECSSNTIVSLYYKIILLSHIVYKRTVDRFDLLSRIGERII